MNEHIIRAFELLSNDIMKLFQDVLASDVGINKKPRADGKNTLKGSRLANTAMIETDVPFIRLILNDYIDEIEQGRKKKAPLVSISDLREWARRKRNTSRQPYIDVDTSSNMEGWNTRKTCYQDVL